MGKKRKLFVIAAIALSVAVIIAEIFLITRTFRNLRGQGVFTAPYFKNVHKKNIDAGNIRGWMTFDYVNKSFKLPAEYLKTKLDISNAKYPNISIDRLSKERHESQSAAIEEVKQMILDFQRANSNAGQGII